MKKIFCTLLILAVGITSMMAHLVQCGCAYPDPNPNPCYDIEIDYMGDGDCCHPTYQGGPGLWFALDCATSEIQDWGQMTPQDALDACEMPALLVVNY